MLLLPKEEWHFLWHSSGKIVSAFVGDCMSTMNSKSNKQLAKDVASMLDDHYLFWMKIYNFSTL